MVAAALCNHDGVHPTVVVGEAGLTAIVASLVSAAARLRRIPFLEWDETGMVVHTFWRDRTIAWPDIEDVGVTARRGEGVTTYIPTVRLTTGRSCLVPGLSSVGGAREAEASAAAISELRERFRRS
jgi:hypothetical protein